MACRPAASSASCPVAIACITTLPRSVCTRAMILSCRELCRKSVASSIGHIEPIDQQVRRSFCNKNFHVDQGFEVAL